MRGRSALLGTPSRRLAVDLLATIDATQSAAATLTVALANVAASAPLADVRALAAYLAGMALITIVSVAVATETAREDIYA